MRIIRLSHGEFCVYSATDRSPDAVAALVRQLRRQQLPFLIGATVADRSRLLTVGPLTAAQAADFARQWALYVE